MQMNLPNSQNGAEIRANKKDGIIIKFEFWIKKKRFQFLREGDEDSEVHTSNINKTKQNK